MEKIDKKITKCKSITLVNNEISLLGVKATLMEDGTIKKERINLVEEKIKNSHKDEEESEPIWLHIAIFVFIAILSILSSFIFLNQMFFSFIVFVLFDVLVFEDKDFFGYLSTIYNFFTKNKLKRTKGLHAAEHMTINAYNHIKRIPQVSEVRKYSRFSNDCRGILKYKESIAFFILMFIIGLADINSSMTVKFIYASIGIVISSIFNMGKLYKYCDIFFLKKPSDKEIEVAIAALEEYEALKKDLRQAPNKVYKETFKIENIKF